MGVNEEVSTRSVAIDKLREDAKNVWRPSAAGVETIGNNLRELELDEKDFSKFASWTNVPSDYETAWESYKKLMKAAHKTFDGIADDLVAAADRYEQRELLNEEAIRGAAAGLED